MTGPGREALDQVAVREALDRVLSAALKLASAERGLASPGGASVTGFRHMEDEVKLASQALAGAVDAQPQEKRPKGWAA